MLHVRTPCPGLELQLAHNVPAGAVAYVNDQLFLHSVGCADGVPAPGAVTLHLYCPPVGCNPLNAVACSTSRGCAQVSRKAAPVALGRLLALTCGLLAPHPLASDQARHPVRAPGRPRGGAQARLLQCQGCAHLGRDASSAHPGCDTSDTLYRGGTCEVRVQHCWQVQRQIRPVLGACACPGLASVRAMAASKPAVQELHLIQPEFPGNSQASLTHHTCQGLHLPKCQDNSAFHVSHSECLRSLALPERSM